MEHGKQERPELLQQEGRGCVEPEEDDKKSDDKQSVGTRTKRDHEREGA